ncbi:MAG: hypothetical protein OK454_11360, partial [Thaumarchaeota archaeon]|nr:hypothetical protein [Nitrososphaerota archaeon]
MAGPRRRTVPFAPEEARTKWARELHVLKRADSLNSDDWPCFVLTDAVVYDKDGSVASLLQLDLRGPFIARGKLEVEETDLQRHRESSPRFCLSAASFQAFAFFHVLTRNLSPPQI